MNNKDKYKSAIDQIHVREELKKKTLNKVTQKKSKLIYFKYVSTIAAVALFAIIGGVTYHNHIKESLDVEKTNYIAKSQISDLKRFDVFPIDVWVRRVMNELYIKMEDETKVNKNDVLKLAKEKYGNLAGLAQQYLFYWKREA